MDVDVDVDTDADGDTDLDCESPLVDCNRQCVDTSTNERHCGACFLNCQVEEGRASGCMDGDCVCGDSTTLCTGDLDDTCCPEGGVGACVNILNDEGNCGICGVHCELPASNLCRNGICTCGIPEAGVDPAGCPEGEECCGDGADAVCAEAGSC